MPPTVIPIRDTASQMYVRSLVVLRASSLTGRPGAARPRGAGPSASGPSPCRCGTASRRRRSGSGGSRRSWSTRWWSGRRSVEDSSNDVPSSVPSATSVKPIGCASVNSMRPASPGRRKPRSKWMGPPSTGRPARLLVAQERVAHVVERQLFHVGERIDRGVLAGALAAPRPQQECERTRRSWCSSGATEPTLSSGLGGWGAPGRSD